MFEAAPDDEKRIEGLKLDVARRYHLAIPRLLGDRPPYFPEYEWQALRKIIRADEVEAGDAPGKRSPAEQAAIKDQAIALSEEELLEFTGEYVGVNQGARLTIILVDGALYWDEAMAHRELLPLPDGRLYQLGYKVSVEYSGDRVFTHDHQRSWEIRRVENTD